MAIGVTKSFTAWAILVAGLAATGTAALLTAREAERDRSERFAYVSDNVADHVRNRLTAYALVLRGGAGLFAASDRVSRAQWARYVDTLRASESVPGVQGVGFSLLIAPAQLQQHVRQVRAEGFDGYTVRPAGDRPVYSSIIYLEPFRDRNLRAFGYDMYSEPVRREAMDRARDSGEAALSGKVVLVQETDVDIQPGTLMYVPVYRNGMPTGSVSERRAALLGWVYSPYRMSDLMSGVLRDWQRNGGNQVALRIFDGGEPRPERLLYSNVPSSNAGNDAKAERRTLDINGRQWLLDIRPGANSPGPGPASWIVLGTGSAISLLLFALFASLASRRESAERMAAALTTDVRRQAALLEQSEARWKFALEGSGLGVWDWNIPEDTAYFSPLWKSMLGYDATEIANRGEEWFSRIHPEDRPAVETSLKDYLEGRSREYSVEYRARARDGGYKWILARGMVIERGADGTPLRMIGTHQDISERKRAELELKNLYASLHQLREALDNVSSHVYIKDLESRYVYANRSTLELFACAADELAGSGDERFFPPDVARRLREIDLRVFAGERTSEEIDVTHPARGRRVYLEIKTPVYADAARTEVRGLCGISTDITEMKLLQESIRRSQADLIEAQRIAQVGSWQLDLATEHVVWTEELYRMLGLDPHRPPPDYTEHSRLFTPESWGRLSRALSHTRETGEPYELELETVRPDGTTGWMLARGEAIRGQDGSISTLRGIAMDITQRRQVQRHAERLSRMYAALSETNAAILRCGSEGELFARLCEVVVRFGGMRLAWVGLTAPDGKVVPVNSHGTGLDYLDGIEIVVSGDDPRGRGPTGTAIRENRPVWVDDFQRDQGTSHWHDRGRPHGWRASAALPICRAGKPIGALTFYAGEVAPFDDETRALLNEMAEQIGFALDKFDVKSRAKASLSSLEESERRFRSLVEQSIAGVFIIQEGRLAYANPRMAEILGSGTAADLIGRDPGEFVASKNRDEVSRSMRAVLEGETGMANVAYTALRLDGGTTEVGANLSRAVHLQRPAIIGLMQDISDKKIAEDHIRRYAERLEHTFMQTVALATTLSELRDPYTAGHERRVADIAVAIGAELGLDEDRLEGLRVGGYLHDVGKTMVPAEILAKPGRLRPIEYELIKGHVTAGYDILKEVDFPWPVAQIALQHHERIDGSGYPKGLKDGEICLEARIVAVADVVESMGSHRPYRAALGLDRALAEIERGRGTLYDAQVADACVRIFREKGYVLPA